MNHSTSSHVRWPVISILLLLIYLAFFHLCLGSGAVNCVVIGVACWLVWCGLCVYFRSVFVNPFEYWIHQFVGIDILLESFNPVHVGYGFYYCALAFWFVFLVYHVFAIRHSQFMQQGDVVADADPAL